MMVPVALLTLALEVPRTTGPADLVTVGREVRLTAVRAGRVTTVPVAPHMMAPVGLLTMVPAAQHIRVLAVRVTPGREGPATPDPEGVAKIVRRSADEIIGIVNSNY